MCQRSARDGGCSIGSGDGPACQGAGAAPSGDARAAALDAHRTFVLDPDEVDPELFLTSLEFAGRLIAGARPTAVNLSWAVERALAEARRLVGEGAAPREVAEALSDLTRALIAEDEAANRAIGAHGAALLPEGCALLTHCNAGSLATAFYGTALGVAYAAAGQGKLARVYADETRPVGQGARLTAWELARAGVPVTLICDDMAASLLASGRVDAVVVGADRIAANGDVANKIGTLGVAVLARRFGVPFYVAAPASTIDASVPDGAAIPIEERAASEVLPAPIPGVDVWNPAFDVTPAELVTAVITERGVFAPDEVTAAHAAPAAPTGGEGR
ncbi:MAG: S-methyl-5-thioribose-1-phosphate isomerase [Eggerthellaceae bacterium]|nr:S-methyl-5-thioribose-1-phosphate isomerase [Eggerthellaceae bacterium]